MTPALYIVIVAMLFQQAMSYMASQVLPSVAPQAGTALGLDPELVLYHTTIFYGVSGCLQALVGGLIIRMGAIRISQLSLLGLGVGLALSMVGELWVFAAVAVMMGAANSVSTPASSHLLARHSPKKYAPLIFSIKQTGVPVGGLIAVGAAGIFVSADAPETWTHAFMATSAICLVLMLIIQPMRKEFDDDRQPGYPIRITDGFRNIVTAVKTPALRDLSLAMTAFVGLQGLFNSIFATYAQTQLGYSQDAALRLLLITNGVAIGARVFWGWVGSSIFSARITLSALAFVMAFSTVAIGWADGWPYWLLAAVTFAFGASTLSWHGLLLAEVARLSPAGLVGPVTGGVLFWGSIGMFTYPMVAKTLRNLDVPYAYIFTAAALPALIMAFRLLRQPPAPAIEPEAESALAPETKRRRALRFLNAGDAEPLWRQPRLPLADAKAAPGLGVALRRKRRRR